MRTYKIDTCHNGTHTIEAETIQIHGNFLVLLDKKENIIVMFNTSIVNTVFAK